MRAQVMSEFLITYGWAILVVLIMMGALAGLSQFGIIKSDHMVPEMCTMRVGFACIDHRVTPDSAHLRLINGFGKDLTVLNISIGDHCHETFNKNFNKGETITFELFDCTNGERRKRFDGQVIIYYKDIGRTMIKKTEGEITARIY